MQISASVEFVLKQKVNFVGMKASNMKCKLIVSQTRNHTPKILGQEQSFCACVP